MCLGLVKSPLLLLSTKILWKVSILAEEMKRLPTEKLETLLLQSKMDNH
jgi:hypothetical protein